MRKLDQTYLKFTQTDGDSYYVSLFRVLNDGLDCYQDDLDKDNLYEWVVSPRGWMYQPIT
jgi:hypothetical protein